MTNTERITQPLTDKENWSDVDDRPANTIPTHSGCLPAQMRSLPARMGLNQPGANLLPRLRGQKLVARSC